MLTKFQFHCSITCRNILYFVFWLPYCHTLWHHQYLICIIQKLWISLEQYEIWQKGKHHSSSLLKAFQNGTLKIFISYPFVCYPENPLNMILKLQCFFMRHIYSCKLPCFLILWPVLDAFHATSFNAPFRINKTTIGVNWISLTNILHELNIKKFILEYRVLLLWP